MLSKNHFKSLLFELGETLLLLLFILSIIYKFIALPERVVGASMEPTLQTKERIVVERISKHFSDFERGEIVVLIPPNLSFEHYVKRVIGVPGDIIKIFDCKVFISNQESRFYLEEPYLYEDTCTLGGDQLQNGRSIKLGDDEYVVLGDNRTRSLDSRSFGVVTKSDILGKVVYRWWPLNKAKVF